jgi:hypothetical protein
MKKANLFIVGAPKCGSTTMYELLKQHPDVVMSAIKEPNFFCKDFLLENKKFYGKKYNFPGLQSEKEKDYLALFNNSNKKKILGDASVWHFYSEAAAKEIYKYNEDAKIIILLRNPVDLLYSLHSELVFNNNEPEKDFQSALNLEDDRLKHKNIPKYIPWPSRLFYSNFLKIDKHTKRYLHVFPKKQIKIIFLSEMKEDIQEVYKQVLGFLNIDQTFSPEFKIHNKNKQTLININIHPIIKKILRTLIPKKIIYYINHNFSKITTKKVERKTLSKTIRKQLEKKSYKNVKNLEELLGKNLLNLWKYDEKD